MGIFNERVTITQQIASLSGTLVDQFVTDHHELEGLNDDDHTQYIPADGSRGFTAPVSGIAPTAPYHLALKDYVDNELTSVSGALADSITTEPPTESGGEAGDVFYDPADGIPYFYDGTREKWLASDRIMMTFSRDGGADGTYLMIGTVSNADTGYYVHNHATIVGIYCTATTGPTDKYFELRNAADSHAYIFDFTFSGTLTYVSSELNADIDSGTVLQAYVGSVGQNVKNVVCQVLMARRYDV